MRRSERRTPGLLLLQGELIFGHFYFRMGNFTDVVFYSQLTFEVFRDPVVAPSGHSYERVAVMEHLRRVGKFDPVTREPLVESDLRPNHSLRNAAHEWLNDHAWAFADIINPNQELAEFTAP